jgi:hypothetical protein
LALPESDRLLTGAEILKADKALEALIEQGIEVDESVINEDLLLAYSLLTDRHQLRYKSIREAAYLGHWPKISKGGTIYGLGAYQRFDEGWLDSIVCWLESCGKKFQPFPSMPDHVIPIPDELTIALAGDWGTGNWGTVKHPAPSTKVGRAMSALKPQITVHLGDIYYTGSEEEADENLIQIWPRGSIGSFALNSNHEMYAEGGKPYFEQILKSDVFSLQGGQSFFALENTNWVIVGLDSAYFSEYKHLYENGSISDAKEIQTNFLKAQARKGKKVILMTHHNALLDNEGGKETRRQLWDQVMQCFPPGMAPAYWYWGHRHNATVYVPQDGVRCRCAGHSALPMGHSSLLQSGKDNGNIIWFEDRNAKDPQVPVRILNGFVSLQIHGDQIIETYYDENGGVAWTSARI